MSSFGTMSNLHSELARSCEAGRPFVFFDVDGTVIARDSFVLFVRRKLRQEPLRVLFLLIAFPLFLAVAGKHGLTTAGKSALLWSLTVFRGRRGAIRLLTEELPDLVAPWIFREASHELARWRAKGYEICFVSASGETWLRPLLARLDSGAKVIIGTKLRFFLGGIALRGRNCLGAEKLVQIERRLGPAVEFVAGYTDHPADIPLLTRCQHRVCVCPAGRHEVVFRLRFSELDVVQWTPCGVGRVYRERYPTAET